MSPSLREIAGEMGTSYLEMVGKEVTVSDQLAAEVLRGGSKFNEVKGSALQHLPDVWEAGTAAMVMGVNNNMVKLRLAEPEYGVDRRLLVVSVGIEADVLVSGE